MKKVKSGREKRVQAEKRKLQECGNNPKQQKLTTLFVKTMPATAPAATVSSSSTQVQLVVQTKQVLYPDGSKNVKESEDSLRLDPEVKISQSKPSDPLIAAISATEQQSSSRTLVGGDSSIKAQTEISEEEESATNGADTSKKNEDLCYNDSDSELCVIEGIVKDDLFRDCASFVPPSKSSSILIKKSFLNLHPIQPSNMEDKVPFDKNRVYFCTLPNGHTVRRRWLSYCKVTNKIYCSHCMVFGKNDSNPFVTGVAVNLKHIYDSVQSHESSSMHDESSKLAFKCSNDKTIETSVNKDMFNLRQEQIKERREIVGRLIDITTYLGRQGLAFRGSSENAASLNDTKVNHDNFLELVILISKFDPLLQAHKVRCIELAKEIKKSREKKGKKDSFGRGSLVTFLSSNFISKLIKSIGRALELSIVNMIKNSPYFSLMLDSTQDVSVLDQCALCVRFVLNGEVTEKLLCMTASHCNTGQGLFNMVVDEFEKREIDLCKLTACSFDGASNMSGKFKGLQSHLKKNINENIIFTHCMGHCLNLVMVDATSSCQNVLNLFGLLNEAAVFLHDSYKRMDTWTEVIKANCSAHSLLKKLAKIGLTRWWSKEKSLTATIDFSQEVNKTCTFFVFMKFLNEIIKNKDFDAKTKYKAMTLKNNFSKFENIITAAVFHDIFTVTSPVSSTLQSKSLNYVDAVQQIKKLKSNVLELRSDAYFLKVYTNCVKYIKDMNQLLESENIKIKLQESFSSKSRVTTNKIKVSPYDYFKIFSYFTVIDKMLTKIDDRFMINLELFYDFSCFDPRNFGGVSSEIPNNRLKNISKLIGVERGILLRELKQFAMYYDSYALNFNFSSSKSDDIDIEDTKDNHSSSTSQRNNPSYCINKQCKNKCINCAYKLLSSLIGDSSQYHNLYLAYEYIVVVPCTQVSCERVFSGLKFVKNRLRSSLSQDHLHYLMLMQQERDLTHTLNKATIIDDIANSSMELKNLLLL